MTRTLRAWLAGAALLTAAVAVAQDDRFAFMPAGGAQLVERALASCEGCDGLAAWSGAARTADEWRTYLAERSALKDLSDAETETLVRYLATAFPADEAVEAPADLPIDGRTLVLFQCQICHSIATPMLEDRGTDSWLQHRTRPPHDGLDLTGAEWAHIANYLDLNAPIPEASIPDEMRQGAGGY